MGGIIQESPGGIIPLHPGGFVGIRTERAEVDAAYIILGIKSVIEDGLADLLKFNMDDYLTRPQLAGGPRFLDLSKCTIEQLGRLTEIGKGKIRGPDKAAVYGQIVAAYARLASVAGLDKGAAGDAIDGLGDRLAIALQRARQVAQEERDELLRNAPARIEGPKRADGAE